MSSRRHPALASPSEASGPVVLAVASIALLIALHVAARACRDALFLSTFAAADLPKAMLAAAGVGLTAVLVSSRAMARFGPGRVVAAFLIASSATYWLEWRLLVTWPGAAVVLVYMHASIAGGIGVSGFWSIVNERFDPHTVRRIAGRLAVGAALGGLLGGLAAHGVGARLGFGPMLLLLSAGSLVAAVGALALSARSVAARPSAPPAADAPSRTSARYLVQMAALVALVGLSSAVVDFAFKATVAGSYRNGASLVSFFAVFYMLVSLAAVGLQLSVSRWILSRFGIGVGLGALPAAVAVLGVVAAILPVGPVIVLLRASGVALESSLFRAAYEPLYAPLPLHEKRSKKTLINVACDRLGEALGSGAVLGFAALSPALGVRAGLVIAVAASTVALWLTSRLERGYVNELAASLREGRVEIEPGHAADATTRLTMSQTQLELDRDALLREIDALRRTGSSRSLVSTSRLGMRLSVLESGDAPRIVQTLRDGPLELELVSLVIPMLSDDATEDAAVAALKTVANRVPGQLVNALLDPELPMRLRRRVPRVLRVAHHPRAVRGLSEALLADQRDLRVRAALALRDITRARPELAPPRRILLEACMKEIESSPDVALDQVMTLLGLLIDAEPLELALRALASGEQKLRGTALEYFEHVIPEPVRSSIWPLLQAERPVPRSVARAPAELAEELRRSFG